MPRLKSMRAVMRSTVDFSFLVDDWGCEDTPASGECMISDLSTVVAQHARIADRLRSRLTRTVGWILWKGVTNG